MQLGPPELLIILLIAVVLFGPRRIPELGRSLGQAIREFRKGVQTSDSGEEQNKRES